MTKKIGISEAESQIMEALWSKAPLTPEEIIAAVGPSNGWAPGTVRTLITRLLRKKALVGSRESDGYLYRPLIARADYVQSESQSLLDRLFGGQVAPLVAHFARHRALTAADFRKLKKLIAELEDDRG
ncbi:MAG TPA: BlaI/MecI/CopY family transcriptional regulator [Rhizomicrobium sp.]|nr:BlaI/MecI/CopY family transcriptional regulator [Rhizomicrobium sp.]